MDEAKDGTLQFRFPEGLSRISDEDERDVPKESHVSVHPSDDFDGNVIMYRVRRDDGNLLSLRTVISSESKRFLRSIIFRRSWNIEENARIRLKDSSHVLRILDQENYTISYIVWVYHPSVILKPNVAPFSRLILNFKRFNVAIYHAISPTPSAPIGTSVFQANYEPYLNDEHSKMDFKLVSFDPSTVNGHNHDFIHELANRYESDLVRVGATAETAKELAEEYSQFGILRYTE